MLKVVASLVVLVAVSASAQVEMQKGSRYAQPHFYFDALNFRDGRTNSRLDFYLQIPYRELQFEKYEGTYLAAYQVDLQLVDNEGNTAVKESWNERAACTNFDETLSNSIVSSTQRHFILRPGAYTLQVSVTDSETDKSYLAKRSFDARDYARATRSISDIMLLRTSTENSGKHTIVPDIEANVISRKSSFPIFYEVYFPMAKDSAMATTEIFGEKNKCLYRHSEWINGSDSTAKVFADIPKDSLPMGFYRLSITLRASDEKNAQILAGASRFFSIHFPELPLTVTDLDRAAEEMLYIASGASIDSIKSAHDMYTKEKRFIQFWQKYNPNPSSDKNPLMEVYYDRVAYANEHFTSYFPGWKTDMGMVYILFGPPNSVDRHPFETDTKPYEVWYYYQRNRQFLFLDATGFGDYRLLNPTEGGYPPPSSTDFFGR